MSKNQEELLNSVTEMLTKTTRNVVKMRHDCGWFQTITDAGKTRCEEAAIIVVKDVLNILTVTNRLLEKESKW